MLGVIGGPAEGDTPMVNSQTPAEHLLKLLKQAYEDAPAVAAANATTAVAVRESRSGSVVPGALTPEMVAAAAGGAGGGGGGETRTAAAPSVSEDIVPRIRGKQISIHASTLLPASPSNLA